MDNPTPDQPDLPTPAREEPAAPSSNTPGKAPVRSKSILRSWLRCWLSALFVGVLSATLVWRALPEEKRASASAKLHMPVGPEGVLFRHSEASTKFENYQKTQLALIKSKLVLNAALREPKVANLPIVLSSNDPVAWLEKDIRVDPSGSLEIVRVSLSGDNAADLKIIVDAVAKAYITEVLDKQLKRRRDRLEELKRLCDLYEDELKRAQDRRRAAEEERNNIKGAMKKLDPVVSERDKLAVEFEDLPQVQLLEEAVCLEPGPTVGNRWVYSILAGLTGFVVVVLFAVWVAYGFRNTSTDLSQPTRNA